MARRIGKVLLEALLICGLASFCAAQTIEYHLEPARPISRFSPRQRAVLMKLNHADAENLPRLRRIIVPDRWDADELLYSPMPATIEAFENLNKALVVALDVQTFGAYEWGALVRWGPVSSGDRLHQTPPGVYHLNWHAVVHTSSEDPTWIMPWYFNFASDLGLALHEYALPGRPASHGCVRLLASDAKWLYNWGEGWTLDGDAGRRVRHGTLVVLTGEYDFSAPPPWLTPEWWDNGISVDLPPIDDMAAAK